MDSSNNFESCELAEVEVAHALASKAAVFFLPVKICPSDA